MSNDIVIRFDSIAQADEFVQCMKLKLAGTGLHCVTNAVRKTIRVTVYDTMWTIVNSIHDGEYYADILERCNQSVGRGAEVPMPSVRAAQPVPEYTEQDVRMSSSNVWTSWTTTTGTTPTARRASTTERAAAQHGETDRERRERIAFWRSLYNSGSPGSY